MHFIYTTVLSFSNTSLLIFNSFVMWIVDRGTYNNKQKLCIHKTKKNIVSFNYHSLPIEVNKN